MPKSSLDRRYFLRIAGLTAIGTATACVARNFKPQTPEDLPVTTSTDCPIKEQAQSLTPVGPASGVKRILRIAHLTDFHVLPMAFAQEQMVNVLRHAQSQADPPDIILNTGDAIMDSLEEDKASTEAQWQVFNDILQAECNLPIYHAIGNHDIWGWGLTDEQIKSDPLYGKNMALEKLSLENRYYSFDLAGWHFIILDSNYPPNEVSEYPYIGQLDEEQFDWMVRDIQAVPGETPICIASHIPIVAACEYFDGPNEETGNWVVPGAWMHIDARRFRQLFLEHPNVRLCLSGHTHQYESLDYLGVRYLTNGAVCGDWWRGSYLDFPPAYVLVDLYEDGRAESQFVAYQEKS